MRKRDGADQTITAGRRNGYRGRWVFRGGLPDNS
jgi:hypothetical protein